MDRGMNKVVIVKRKTRLEELKIRYNTFEQAKFYVEHLGADFSDYEKEHKNYYNALETVRRYAETNARVQEIDRDYIPNMIFGENDIVVALGQDGLVANLLKYLNGQPLIGVNPDIERYDGILLPFEAGDLQSMIPRVILGAYSKKQITMAQASTRDGQVLYAVNDFFLGINNHTSARYNINFNGSVENQSSSGVIISTGIGMTGWHRSVMAEFRGMARAFNLGGFEEPVYEWDAKRLVFQVREPYPSRFTQAEMVYGEVTPDDSLTFVSNMTEGGVIFSDGILDDTIEFGAGMEVRVGIADRVGCLVVN